MALDTSKLTDEEFIFAYVVDHAEDEVDGATRDRYRSIYQNESHKTLIDGYHTSLGQLQLQMQGYYVDGNQLAELHDLIETPDLRKTHELKLIENMSRSEFYSSVRRRLAIGLILAVIVSIVYGYLKPASMVKFAPLDLITYESVAMMEEPLQRLALTSDDPVEVLEYLSNDPQLKFKPRILNPNDTDWGIQGASIIDYENFHMSVTQYHNVAINETVFFYLIPGTIKDMPASEPGNYNGLIYQAYESELFNIIVWPLTETTLGYLVGRLSAPDLAKFAHSGSR